MDIILKFIISKAQYTAKRYLLFYMRHGPYTLDKTVKVFGCYKLGWSENHLLLSVNVDDFASTAI